MPPTSFLSQDDAKGTKCTMCKNYLSVPPVIIQSNNIVCGRCVDTHKLSKDNRAQFYENLAKSMFFPCKNDANGCSAKIPWGNVLAHETNCTFEKITCPAINCENKIINDDIIKHFQNSHQNLILDRSLFRLPQEDTLSCINKILISKDNLFVIHTKSDGEDISVRISSVKGSTKTIRMQLNSTSSSSSICLNKFEVVKYHSKTPNFSDKEKIGIKGLKNVLGNDISGTFIFDHEAKVPQDKHDVQLFREMECPICTIYMRPPIYMCNTGHSLCHQCREKVQRCPSCSCPFSNSRNYSLEKIAQVVRYPCRNKDRGCVFVANIENITAHESNCSISEGHISCFLNRAYYCQWAGSYSAAFQHVSTSHPDMCVQLGTSITISASSNSEIKRFFLYDRKLFALNIIFVGNSYSSSNETVKWAVSYITKEKLPHRYMFLLEIIKGNKFLSVNGNCEKTEPKNLIFSNYIILPKTLIKDFKNSQDNITFRINIANYDV